MRDMQSIGLSQSCIYCMNPPPKLSHGYTLKLAWDGFHTLVSSSRQIPNCSTTEIYWDPSTDYKKTSNTGGHYPRLFWGGQHCLKCFLYLDSYTYFKIACIQFQINISQPSKRKSGPCYGTEVHHVSPFPKLGWYDGVLHFLTHKLLFV